MKLKKQLFPRLSDGLICAQFYILLTALLVVIEVKAAVFISASAVFALILLFFYFRLAEKMSAFVRRELRIVWIIDFFSIIYSAQSLLDASSYTSQELSLAVCTLFYSLIDLARWKLDA